MPALASDLRRQLESVVTQARDLAEAAARSALQKRAVDAAEPFEHFNTQDREQRTRLRARGRQVGDVRDPRKETQTIDQLTQELAYEYWHRMLFARFLAENNLLMHPDGVSVSLDECEELAPSENAANGYILAARYASRMLPQIFRTDDVLLEIEFATEQRLALEKLLASLPTQTFTADDSLGWVYQFWQTKKKDEVNESGAKIDGRTLPAVTQLFTEHYMVQFLLHNTIGAWWCARHNVKGPPGGAGVPAGKVPVEMEYLRWREDGTPAAGTFEGWPKTLKEFTMLDPCCGSGHFLVAAFNLLVPLRMHDEGLSAQAACDEVLREHLHGLELDPRCTQIAAFALALAAWKYPGEDGQPLGYRTLPPLNIACSGQGVTGKKEEWLALANGDDRLREGMDRLYDLFRQAPHLGSLIDPRSEKGDLFEAGYAELRPLLEKSLSKEKTRKDADTIAVGISAQGVAKAAELLGQQYTLVATNVPYLGRGKQDECIKDYCHELYPDSMFDLATVFIERALKLSGSGGHAAMVTPSGWLSLKTYESLRLELLKSDSWTVLARLGARAFETISGEVVNVTLAVINRSEPLTGHHVLAVDISEAEQPRDKAASLMCQPFEQHLQSSIARHPAARFVFSAYDHKLPKLGEYCTVLQGSSTGDDAKFVRCFWEVSDFVSEWKLFLSAPDNGIASGREFVWRWPNDQCELAYFPEARIRGKSSWGRTGFVVAGSSKVSATIYRGEFFNKLLVTIIPKRAETSGAVWAYLCSDELSDNVRKLDTKNLITPGVFASVPFDFERWKIASEGVALPDVLTSSNPTQWLFKGTIAACTDPLQVAVARLLGYRWPEQPKEADTLDDLETKDNIVCIPAVRGQAPASERLLEVLRAAFGSSWSAALLDKLLTDTGCKAGVSLEDWLRNQFFEQHCKRFHHRPFIWHVWDGRKDGFACLVNYHKLNHKTLENLTYSYLQDWITAQANDAREAKTGADLRLQAAQDLQEKLKLILTGEPPYDIFVRWKSLEEQPIGWNPDLNDGVRLNIRPFITAGILRKNPNIKWTKDRGNDPESAPWFKVFQGDRINDHHLTIAEKQAARLEAERRK